MVNHSTKAADNHHYFTPDSFVFSPFTPPGILGSRCPGASTCPGNGKSWPRKTEGHLLIRKSGCQGAALISTGDRDIGFQQDQSGYAGKSRRHQRFTAKEFLSERRTGATSPKSGFSAHAWPGIEVLDFLAVPGPRDWRLSAGGGCVQQQQSALPAVS